MTSSGKTPRDTDQQRLRRALRAALAFTLLLWIVKLAEATSGGSLTELGILPRQLAGLDGVLWAPLIHGSWTHLFANTGPVLVLGTALLYGYPRAAVVALPAMYLGVGLAVWLFARPAFHIGASGLTFAALSFVFTMGVLRWDRRAIALAMIVAFLYGGSIWGILPTDPSVSFESHLFGAIIGVALAIALRRRDPPPPRRRYSWEEEDDSIIDGELGEDARPADQRSPPRG